MSSLFLLALLIMPAPAASASAYVLGPDSKRQEGVPEGRVTQHTWTQSRVYPGTTHTYWVYVPAQYDGTEPACVMIFQDGSLYADVEGAVRVPTVFDNLIHRGEMPVTVGVFLDPGQKDQPWDQRQAQYTPLDDTYARFLLEEILPEVGRSYSLTSDASGRAIGGWSDGGLASFTAVWERPDAFSKAVSFVGSFTRLRGGSEYPYLIRQTRGAPRPIRVFLQGGEADINLREGDWVLANLQMESALQFARYDFRFVMGKGGHDLEQGGSLFPDIMRWLWRDHPGVKNQPKPSPEAVVGSWEISTSVLGDLQRSRLTIELRDDQLAATLEDESHGSLDIENVRFEDGILTYEYQAPAGKMLAWLRVSEDSLQGALSESPDTRAKPDDLDYRVVGRRLPPVR